MPEVCSTFMYLLQSDGVSKGADITAGLTVLLAASKWQIEWEEACHVMQLVEKEQNDAPLRALHELCNPATDRNHARRC